MQNWLDFLPTKKTLCEKRDGVAALVRKHAAPSSPFHPYLRLMRIDKPTGTWLLLLPCWWGVAFSADFFPNLWLMFLFAVGAVIMRGAGCVINDIYDRKLDRMVERTKTRPLACGDVSLSQALIFLAVLLLLGLGVLLLFNRETVILGVCSLIPVAIYPLMKRITWWPQLFLGLTFNWGVLMGGSAVTGSLDATHIIAYLAGVFWTLGYDTIYAHQDKRDDAQVGIKSTALLFKDRPVLWVCLFYALCLGLLAVAGWFVDGAMEGTYSWGLLIAACFMGVHLALWNPDDPESCDTRFRANRDFGLIVLMSIILGKML